MMDPIETCQWTDEQLMSLPHMGKAEVIDGRLIMAPAGFEHGGICTLLVAELLTYVRRNGLGWVFDSSTGFRMPSTDVFSLDVAFVSADRLRGLNRFPKRFFRGAPDLAAEILSPNDRPDEMKLKTVQLFGNGCRLMWVVDPDARTVTVHRGPDPHHLVDATGRLDGEDVIPGFELPVAELLAMPRFK